MLDTIHLAAESTIGLISMASTNHRPRASVQLSTILKTCHTRGFYERAGALYHCARGTALKGSFWLPLAGGRWRINWPRTKRGA